MSASLALQTAVVAALKADAVLASLVGGRVHDGAPQGTGFPHVSLGEMRARDWSTSSDEGLEHLAALEIRSQAGGRREVLEIAGAMVAVLDGAELPVEGHRLVNCRIESVETRREGDGRTWRGRLRLRAVMERL